VLFLQAVQCTIGALFARLACFTTPQPSTGWQNLATLSSEGSITAPWFQYATVRAHYPHLSLFHYINTLAISACSPNIHLMCAIFVADWLLLHPRHVFQQLRTFLRQLPNSGLLVCDKALLHVRLSACRLCIYLVALGSGTAANSQIFLRCCHSS
jgi:hypothetical protein